MKLQTGFRFENCFHEKQSESSKVFCSLMNLKKVMNTQVYQTAELIVEIESIM